MIPYFAWHTIQLGPITLQVWGLFVAIGFLVGTFLAMRLAKQRGDNPQLIQNLVPWLVFAAIIGGRLGDIIFYNLDYYLANPAQIIAVWQGGSSFFGGLIACILTAIIYFKYHQVNWWRYADLLAFGLPFGYFFGRVGCFLIHDHPGTATHFFLGVKYPDGIVRHDLGLELALNALVMSVAFLWLAKKPRPVGTFLIIYSIWYGVIRFILDFYRVNDITYWGLTPAQYFCLALIGGGIVLKIKQSSSKSSLVDEQIGRTV